MVVGLRPGVPVQKWRYSAHKVYSNTGNRYLSSKLTTCVVYSKANSNIQPNKDPMKILPRDMQKQDLVTRPDQNVGVG